MHLEGYTQVWGDLEDSVELIGALDVSTGKGEGSQQF